MKIIDQILIIVVSQLLLLLTACGENYTVKANVVGESGSSIEGVSVKVTFEGYQRDKNVVVEKKTDES